jgi:PAS domain S-box-containing protein
MSRPIPSTGHAARGAASTGDALAAALERLPQAGEAVWLRGLLGVVVAVLILAAWAFVAAADNLAVSSAGDAEALNLAGRQVFLAEHMAADALAAGNGVDSALPLEETLDKMRNDAVRLYELRGVWGSSDDEPGHWTARRERLWAAAQSLQMARERGDPQLEHYVARVQGEARQFITAMEQAVSELQTAAEDRHRETRRAHAVLVGLLALGITTLLLGLGEPLARRIQQHHAKLAAQTQQLQRLALVADRTQNAVVITDAQARVVWANAAFTGVTGYSLEEACGLRLGTLMQASESDDTAASAPRAALSRALDEGTPLRVELLNRGKHGRSYWVDLDIQPLRNDAGTLTGFVAVETDITSQVERRQYLDAILRALPAGLLVQDARGRIVDANQKAEQLTGIPRDELIGRESVDPRWAMVNAEGLPLRPVDLPSLVTLRTGEAQEDRPIGVRTPEGQRRWLRVNTQTLRGPGGGSKVSQRSSATVRRQWYFSHTAAARPRSVWASSMSSRHRESVTAVPFECAITGRSPFDCVWPMSREQRTCRPDNRVKSARSEENLLPPGRLRGHDLASGARGSGEKLSDHVDGRGHAPRIRQPTRSTTRFSNGTRVLASSGASATEQSDCSSGPRAASDTRTAKSLRWIAWPCTSTSVSARSTRKVSQLRAIALTGMRIA